MTRPCRRRIAAGRLVRAALSGLAALALAGASPARADLEFYLEADGIPMASATRSAPAASSLSNPDPLRDGLPGLVIQRGGSGPAETDPLKHQMWVGPAGGVTIDGPVELRFWAAMKGFATGLRGVVEAYLLDCDAGGSACVPIASGRREIRSWNGPWGAWREHAIELGEISYTVAAGRAPSIKIVVGAASGDDMWFAYGSADYPARVTDAGVSDIVIDGQFGDWLGPGGMQVDLVDESGPDDWGSPERLDLTWFAVSTNTVDALHILMGVDDVPARDVVMATLIDTDLDGNADFALAAEVDESGSTVELYACDDSLPDGCPGDVLITVYPSTSFQVGAAPGPWGQDTLLEMVLPFDDLQGDVLVMTGLVSYAAKSLLTSPKDAIFGAGGQAPTDRIHYDPATGQATLVSGLGDTYFVRRHSDPGQVRGAEPIRSILAAPFDDLPGSLSDGEAYYYVMERETGVPVTVSAHSNTAGDAVRLGFDDHDDLSAPVDAARSKVTAGASAVAADGTSFAIVTLVPRDASGIPLGSGCQVGVDQAALGPAVMAGPVEDHLNGTYSFRLSSIAAGTAQVILSVEGVILDDSPSIDFN